MSGPTINSVKKLCIVAILSAAVLATAFIKFVPLRVDGGMYAYPALALVEGRDPGDNQLSVEELSSAKPGRKAKFYWDSRRNLYVLPTAAWFSLFGASYRSIHAFGVTQLILFAAVSWLLFRNFGGERKIALTCWAVLCTDSVLVSNGAADARPDVMIATLAVLLLLSILHLMREEKQHLVFLAGIVIALVMPLVHLTSLATIVALACFAMLYALRSAPSIPRRAFALLVLALVVFFARTRALDFLIPTTVHEAFAQNPYDMMAGKLARGILEFIRTEGVRWWDYVWPSNFIQMLIVLAGLFTALRFVDRARFSVCVFLGCASAYGLIALSSPLPRTDHLIALMPLMLLASSRALTDSELSNKFGSIAVILPLLLILNVAAKLIHAGYVVHRFGQTAAIENAAVASMFADVIPSDKLSLIVGPTEIWPYIPANRNVVIADRRGQTFDFSGDRWQQVQFVVLNQEYAQYGWASRFKEKFPALELKEIRYVGERSGPVFFGVYKVLPKPTLGGDPLP